MRTHLSLSERALIERSLAQSDTFADIARKLNRSLSTISREVKNRRVFVNKFNQSGNDCASYYSCLRRNLCSTETKYSCYSRCKLCSEYNCRSLCDSYVSQCCPLLDKPPYVCSNCPQQKTCKRNHAYYTAHRAHAEYLKELKQSRQGLRTKPNDLIKIGNLISQLILKGQSINHIFSTHSEEIGLSERTIYSYIDSNAFNVKNIDLPKKVRYRQRRTKPVLTKLEYQYRRGRTYADFNSFMELHPNKPVVEMDTMKGARGSKQVLLTMIFRNSNFMLIFLMKDGTMQSVLSIFDFLTERLGLDIFKKLFPVILTDNGVEFKDPHSLEYASNGCQRTRLFFCDPQASWQKPHVEKNHVLIRRILPKGTSFKDLSQPDINLIACHVNSVARELFENKTPFELFHGKECEKLLDLLNLSPIPPDDVYLKLALLNH